MATRTATAQHMTLDEVSRIVQVAWDERPLVPLAWSLLANNARRSDYHSRRHPPRGRHQQQAPGALSEADVEPAGGAMTTWLRRQLEGLGR